MKRADGAAVGDDGLTAQQREARAKHRFLLERLLDSAQLGVDRLDAMLQENQALLDGGFFAHLQWEVEQQREQWRHNAVARRAGRRGAFALPLPLRGQVPK